MPPDSAPRDPAEPIAGRRDAVSPSLDPVAPPLPGRPIIRQRWSDLVFLHWRVAPSVVAPFMPAGTRPDVDENGDTWVGLIPFVLSHSQFFPPLPAVPYFGTFVECNVRLYSIDTAGNRGVVFRSLDAQRLIPVLTARALFGLPYRWARMSVERAHPHPGFDGTSRIEYRSRRLEGRRRGRLDDTLVTDGTGDGMSARPSTHIVARPGTTPVDTELSRFLTARWGFHEHGRSAGHPASASSTSASSASTSSALADVGRATQRGGTIWARNHHEPWPLVDATLEHLDDELLAAAGFPGLASRTPDSVLYSPGVTTVFARPIRIT